MKAKISLAINFLVILALLMPAGMPARANVDAAPPQPPQPDSPPVGSVTPSKIEPPAPGNLPIEVEQERAWEGMQAVLTKFQARLGEEYAFSLGPATLEGEWAYAVAEWQSEMRLTDSPLYVLARHQQDGSWLAALPEQGETYIQWLNEFPPSLLSDYTKGDVLAVYKIVLEFLRTKNDFDAKFENYKILYSDRSGLYLLDHNLGQPIRIGADLPVPTQFLYKSPHIFEDPNDLPFEINLTTGYIYYSGLLSPSGKSFLFVELECDEDICSRNYKVWIFDTSTFETRQLNFEPSVNNKGKIPKPIAWDESKNEIVFDTYSMIEQLPFTGLWVYDLFNERASSLDLGKGGYNGRFWLSPDNRYLLTSGTDAEYLTYRDIVDKPTSIIKVIDLSSYEVSSFNQPPIGQDYYHVRGWISSDKLEVLQKYLDTVETPAQTLDVPPATSGFQRPMSNDHYGYQWLSWTGSVYHPGDDYNGPGAGNADCDTDINAVAAGLVKYVNTGSWGGIVIEHNWQGVTVYSQYGHVDTAQVSVDQHVTKGQHIAEMGNVATESCHLHWEIRESDHPNPTNGSYWTTSVLAVQSNVENYYEDPEWWVDNHGPYGTSCPSSGGVILYKHANYDCGGEGEGAGYVQRSSTGWQNLPSGINDQPSSVRVPSGWSVKLFEHGDRGGASTCRGGDDNDFSGDTFDGSSVQLNDHVSSFEVFDNNNCGGGTPSGSWSANYYDNHDRWWDPNNSNNWKCSETISGPTLDKNYGSSSPCGNMDGDNWVGDYSATINFPSGNYVFWIDHDDGLKVWHNGTNIADRGGSGSSWICPARYLSGDQSLRVLLREDGGDARAKLTWSLDSGQCTPQYPDLLPYTPSGYPYPVTPSSVQGTHTVDTLVAGDPTYFDWHFINNGNATASGSFYVELWIDNTLHIRYPYSNFGAGQSGGFDDWQLTVDSSGWHTVRLVTDPDGSISESNEGNNTWEAQFYWEPPVNCNDPSEPNNDAGQATALSMGQTASGTICPQGDYDYYAFYGNAGERVIADIDAALVGSPLDSVVSLIASDGTTILTENDDELYPALIDSKLGYELLQTGMYYLRVRAFGHPSVGDASYTYSLHLYLDNINPASASFTAPPANAWLDPIVEPLSADATDNESGVKRVEFLWHDGDWSNPDWTWLGADNDWRDGWNFAFDTASVPETSGGSFYLWAFDWAGNWTGAGLGVSGLDRTAPTFSASTSQMYGGAPFLDFWVNWPGSDNISGIASYDVQYKDGISGAWTNLLTGTSDTSYRFVGTVGHTYYFQVRAVDFAGNQSPYPGGNGQTSYTVSVCPIAADGYEADNAYTSAKWITSDGAWQAHNTHAIGDQDWVKFYAVANTPYTLSTENTGGYADTVLNLYGTNGSTLLASNDDYAGMGWASRIDWTAPTSGFYFVRIIHWDENAYGCSTTYNLSVAPNGSNFVSNGGQDGYIREASENSSTGGRLGISAFVLGAGDDFQDRQYVSILSFDTASLPDNAVIQAAYLELDWSRTAGSPSGLGVMTVDIRQGYFGSSASLELSDFQASAQASSVSSLVSTVDAKRFIAEINTTGRGYINRTGPTQMRLRFPTADDDDLLNDQLGFASGDIPNTSRRPRLVVVYTLP